MNTTTRKPANHALHLFLTVITFGLWLPGWIIAAMVGRKETVTTHNWVAPNLHHQAPYQQTYPGQLFHEYPEPQPVQRPVPQYNPYSGTWN